MNEDLKEAIISYAKIDELKIDKIAEENPELLKAELEELSKDIEENGQLHPVVVYNRSVIDGRNRLKAIKLINSKVDANKKLDLKVIYVNTSKEDAINLAKSYNDKRRHISKSQYAMMAAYKIVKLRVNDKGEKLPKTEWLPIADVEEIKTKKVSERMVKNAISILNNKVHEKLAKKVFEGKIDLSDALQEIYGNKDSNKTKPKDSTIDELKSQYSDEVAKKYELYIDDSKKYSRQFLAKQLVELEYQLENKQ